jgi:AraC-like DNA-binding protein
MVDASILHFLPELVRELGGEPEVLLRRARIDPMVIRTSGAVVEYRSVVHVLQNAAAELSCPDFGLRLAARQDGDKALGPMGIVLKNSQTLGQAIDYCSSHIHAYSLATRARLEPEGADHHLLRVEILVAGVLPKDQTMEHALMLATQNISKLTDGAARVRRVLFSHEPGSPLQTYRSFFGCDISFGQRADGIILSDEDLRQPISHPDMTVYKMATSFIETRFPDAQPPLRACVQSLIAQHLSGEACTKNRVAAALQLHPRTLQRRLRTEGASFDDIKDEVRRDMALRYIKQADLPLTRVAEKLGYADTSVLVRSGYRWFAATPGQLRRKLRSEVGAIV